MGLTGFVADPELASWMDKRLHWMRHGKEKKVLRERAVLDKMAEEAGHIVEREQGYFAHHA